MKRVLLFVALFISFATAKDRIWKDAVLVDIESSTRENGIASTPVGNTTIQFPVRSVWTYYRFETSDTVYVMAMVNHKPLNFTLKKKTQLATEGMKAFVRDDDGKEVKLNIVQKVSK